MKKTTFIIPLLFAGLVSTAQNTSEDAQISGNGEVTVFSREEILARIAANNQNNATDTADEPATSSIATGTITANGDEGVTTVDTETSGNATLTATANGDLVAQEPAANAVDAPENTTAPSTESVNTVDSQISGNGEVTVFSREEILARIAANNQNNATDTADEPVNSSSATGTITANGDEGLTTLETETSGNATLTATANGETVAEETSTNDVAAPVEAQAPIRVILFPNPARRSLVVFAPSVKLTRVEITSASGELLKSENINGLSRARINVSDLQEGLYFANVYSNEGRTVERFFKR
jgi:hypothetical protein